jgi:uncharacterized protein YndB with AHSA1/START domain
MPTAALATDTIQLRRSYSAPVDAVWHAWTSPEALSRWFRPSDEHLHGWTSCLERLGAIR